MRTIILLLLITALSLGCIGPATPQYTCPSGETVSSFSDCPKIKPVDSKPGLTAQLGGCDKVTDPEGKYACYTNAAIDYDDLIVCDRMEDMWWKYFCYQKLGGVWVWGPVDTTTTIVTTTTSTSTTTTTTTLCGNGVINQGEDCDMGSVCVGADGVCGLTLNKPQLAVCLTEGVCNWNIQTQVELPYTMGSCNGCMGKESSSPCKCILVTVLNTTRTTLPSGSITPTTDAPTIYHSVCSEGLCRRDSGAGVDECMTNDQCRHYECLSVSGDLRCSLVRTPGISQCATNAECEVTSTT